VADVVVAVVGKPFGLEGEVYLYPDPDFGDAVAPGRCYAVDGWWNGLTVAGTRRHQGRQLASFREVADRDQAESLRGAELRLAKEALSLSADAFWVADLVGQEVVDEHGGLVGVVESARDGVAHDYLVIARPDGGEIEVPAVYELLRPGEDLLVLESVPGLVDPAEQTAAAGHAAGEPGGGEPGGGEPGGGEPGGGESEAGESEASGS
jgi:16S rRNA processing protein RimM